MVNAGAGLDCWSSPHMDAEQRRQREFRERRREAEERRGWRGSARIHGIEARANSSPRSPSSRACRGTWRAGRSDLKRRRRWQGTWGRRRLWLKAPATGTTGGVRSGVGESIPGDKMTWRSAGLEIRAATMRSKAAGPPARLRKELVSLRRRRERGGCRKRRTMARGGAAARLIRR